MGCVRIDLWPFLGAMIVAWLSWGILVAYDLLVFGYGRLNVIFVIST